jgi:hypothetical protein
MMTILRDVRNDGIFAALLFFDHCLLPYACRLFPHYLLKYSLTTIFHNTPLQKKDHTAQPFVEQMNCGVYIKISLGSEKLLMLIDHLSWIQNTILVT